MLISYGDKKVLMLSFFCIITKWLCEHDLLFHVYLHVSDNVMYLDGIQSPTSVMNKVRVWKKE